MCYSGKCYFETYFGGCAVSDFSKFYQQYGYTPCIVGGYATSVEEDRFMNNNQNALDMVIEKYNSEL